MTDELGAFKREAIESFHPQLEAAFSLAEYRERWARLRAAMAAAEVDCLYLTAPESINYLTGFAAEWYQANGPKEWMPASGVAIHVDHEEPVQFETLEEATLLQLTSVVADVKLSADEGPELQDFIGAELAAAGWLQGKVGMEMRSYRPHRLASERFQSVLEGHGASVVDATEILRRLRRYKSPQELAYVRTAQRIADIGMAAAAEAIAPGTTELEVYGAMVEAMSRAGGEVAAIPLPVVSGPRAATVHGLAGRRVMIPGDIVNVDICGVYHRYHSNMARCFSIGEPEPTVRSRIELVLGGVAVVADVLRPGMPVRELLDAANEYFGGCGLIGDEWWIGGYELGLAFPPDWVGDFEYTLGVDPGDEVFGVGEVCNFEANFYLPHQKGLAMSINTMAFESDRAEFLQETPSELVVVEGR